MLRSRQEGRNARSRKAAAVQRGITTAHSVTSRSRVPTCRREYGGEVGRERVANAAANEVGRSVAAAGSKGKKGEIKNKEVCRQAAVPLPVWCAEGTCRQEREVKRRGA